VSLLSLLRAPKQDEARGLTDWGPWSPSGVGAVNEVTAFNLSGVWACETLIADAIATMPVDTYRKTSDGRVPLGNPRWIDQPNEFTNKIDYDTQRILSLLGWGGSAALLFRKDGSTDPMAPIVGRQTVDPWRVDIRDYAGKARVFIDGKLIPEAWVQYIPGYRLPGSMKGMSVIANANGGLTAGMAAEELAKNIYENGLNTSGVVSIPNMPKETSADTIERISDKIKQWYAGAKNAGKPLVLTGGTTWQPMSVTPHDAQFLETRQFQIEEIARWFRVPPHMIGQIDKESSWGTGIEQQGLGFVRYTLMPWIARLEAADSALLQSPRYVKYNTDALIRADIKTRYEVYAIARQWGLKSANDILRLEDEQPIDNGDIYLQPLNFTEAGTDPSAPGAATPPGDTNGPL